LELASWWPIELVRIHGAYFALGALATRYGWTGRVGRSPSATLALMVVLGYGAVAAAVVRPPGDGLHLVSRSAVALCGIAASVAIAVTLSRARALDFVRVMGVHSLEIYVAHTIASAGLRIALVEGLAIHNVATHVAVGTVGGVVLPVLLSRLCQRFHAELFSRLPGRADLPENRWFEIEASPRTTKSGLPS
jgi:peptidoglycan/LPS O-acetylase OafA/YrhL